MTDPNEPNEPTTSGPPPDDAARPGPAQTGPAQSEPAQSEPAKPAAAETEGGEAEPAQAGATQPESERAEPAQSESGKPAAAQATRGEPAKPSDAQADPASAGTEQADSAQAEPEKPGAEAPPVPVGWLPESAEDLFGEGATAEEAYGLLTVDVPPGTWLPSLETARDRLGCGYFDWLSAVDEPGTGFRVCAHLVALPAAGTALHRLVLRTTVPHETPELPSATGVYAGASWHERETHEMFGIAFADHPHLVPLLLPDTFEGHPLRKDFVLAARVAKAWPGAKEPGESGHGGPKRRQMLPPGVPDPNEWGPLKGQLPPVPARPARGRGRTEGAAGERPARRTRSASAGSASQQRAAAAEPSEGTPAEGTAAPEPPRSTDAPWHKPAPSGQPAPPEQAEQAEQPAQSEPAAKPEPAGKPGQPAQPEHPAEPEQQTQPEQPAGPAEPEQPAQPERAPESERRDDA